MMSHCSLYKALNSLSIFSDGYLYLLCQCLISRLFHSFVLNALALQKPSPLFFSFDCYIFTNPYTIQTTYDW